MRRKDVNSGREHRGERVAVGTIAPNGPDFQVLCPSLPISLSLKVEGVSYCVGSGGNLVHSNLKWVEQEYFTGLSVTSSLVLTCVAAHCIFQVSVYVCSEVNICWCGWSLISLIPGAICLIASTRKQTVPYWYRKTSIYP
ncbi:hypothetical protein I79_009541 [Cricetulus griseus]|uniref:Uncharacterized protein n=1 Tax=Cricetulus griseus TaxID=10029 RepID=G3HG22_CRIGR|nr:hypothetical protein I79_009541 [Cricetulus griseus]